MMVIYPLALASSAEATEGWVCDGCERSRDVGGVMRDTRARWRRDGDGRARC